MTEYYYAAGKKVKLNRLSDSFAVKYKAGITSKAMESKLVERAYFANAEERKELPKQRIVIVTLPPTHRLADIEDSIISLKDDTDVEFITPVYRESLSGLRLVLTDEITVRFKRDVSQADIENFNKANEVKVIRKNRYVPNQFILQVKNPKDTMKLANKYHESDLTEFAEPNFITEVQKAALPNDEFIDEQWHLHNIKQGGGLDGEDVSAKEAWDFTVGSPNITIAIIDDGVDIDHPDLQSNIWKNPDESEPDIHGWNFYDDNNNPRPQKFSPPYHELGGNDSHGTPCAGVAAAYGDNETGVAGIAYRCKILPVKVFLGDDLVTSEILANAIRYAGQKADVLSNSWSAPPSSDVEQAIKEVVQTGRGGKGAPVFVATGNDFKDFISFPASVPESIAVGASDNKGRRSYYSNYGEGIDFVAPSSGGTKGIFTTDISISGRGFNVGDINKGDAAGLYYNSFGGTSSATPLAAGIAALILSVNPDLRWDQVRSYMRNTADKIDLANGDYENGYSLQYGYGRVNAYRALKTVQEDKNGTHVISKQVSPALLIPDHNLEGIISSINIEEEGTISLIEEIYVNISHTYLGDLYVSLIAPGNKEIDLHQGQGGIAENLIKTYTISNTSALEQLVGKGVRGNWLLKVVDRSPQNIGIINSWGLKIRVNDSIVRKSIWPGIQIPDNDPKGIVSKFNLSSQGQIKEITLSLDISHTYIEDLTVSLISPSNTSVLVHNRTVGNIVNLRAEYNVESCPQLGNLLGENIFGEWKLAVADHMGFDTGKLNWWEIVIRI